MAKWTVEMSKCWPKNVKLAALPKNVCFNPKRFRRIVRQIIEQDEANKDNAGKDVSTYQGYINKPAIVANMARQLM